MLTSIRCCSSGPPPDPATPVRRTPVPLNEQGLLGAPKKNLTRKRHHADLAGGDCAPHPPNTDVFSTPYTYDPERRAAAGAPGPKPEPGCDMRGTPGTSVSGNISFKPTRVEPFKAPRATGHGSRSKLMSHSGVHATMSTPERDILAAKRMIEAYKLRTTRLERRERDLLCQLAVKREAVKDTKVEAERALAELVTAEETISRLEGVLEEYKRKADRYQRWWLTENRSLKVIAQALPASDAEDFNQVVASSQARYAVYRSDSL